MEEKIMIFLVTMSLLIAGTAPGQVSGIEAVEASVSNPSEQIPHKPHTALTAPATEPETVPETEPATEVPTEPEPDPKEVEMLAILIYQEAGGDASCDECRRRVADVALNRVADPRFPNTLEAVLTAPRQYGRFHWTGIRWADRAQNPGEAHAVERARRIAREVLQGQHSDLYGKGYIWQAGFHQGTDEVYCCGTWYGR